MALPNFLVLGAPKAGTTALHVALRQHPQIYMSPVKEPHFFAFGELPDLQFHGPHGSSLVRRVFATPDAYARLFDGVTTETVVGEASMTNLLPRARQRIHQYVPAAKLVVILRQPAARAYSQFVYARQLGLEPLSSFEQALAAEEERVAAQWLPTLCYRQRGYYHALLAPFFACFPRSQIRIYRYEEWQARPMAVLCDLFRFLAVDDTFAPDLSQRHNVSRWIRSPALAAWLARPDWIKTGLKPLLPRMLRDRLRAIVMQHNMVAPPPLSPVLYRRLTEEYRADIVQLQALLGQDFSDWLAFPAGRD